MNAFAAETTRLNRRETKLVSTLGFLGSKKLAATQQKIFPHSLPYHGFNPEGLSSELGCWIERDDSQRRQVQWILEELLQFVAGEPILPVGFAPVIDANALAAHETACERFAPTTTGWTARVT